MGAEGGLVGSLGYAGLAVVRVPDRPAGMYTQADGGAVESQDKSQGSRVKHGLASGDPVCLRNPGPSDRVCRTMPDDLVRETCREPMPACVIHWPIV